MVLSIAQAYTTVMGIYVNHLGYHLKDIPLDELNLVLAAKVWRYTARWTLDIGVRTD